MISRLWSMLFAVFFGYLNIHLFLSARHCGIMLKIHATDLMAFDILGWNVCKFEIGYLYKSYTKKCAKNNFEKQKKKINVYIRNWLILIGRRLLCLLKITSKNIFRVNTTKQWHKWHSNSYRYFKKKRRKKKLWSHHLKLQSCHSSPQKSDDSTNLANHQ